MKLEQQIRRNKKLKLLKGIQWQLFMDKHMKSSSQANHFSEIVISAKYTEHNITRFNKATQNNTFYI